ncbi:MAG: hypothetical protein II567_03920 [Candidatus Riflebacteria bacterium]|nr:hypothetical protein [Candidatus Riflebacteria bacterium]
MKYYLVDYENTKKEGLIGISSLSKNDVICVFCKKEIDLASVIFDSAKTNAKKIEQKVEIETKNALYCELSSYLGYLIKENSDNQYDYYIVSNHKGFENLSLYWKKKNVNVSVISDIGSNYIIKDVNKDIFYLTREAIDNQKELEKPEHDYGHYVFISEDSNNIDKNTGKQDLPINNIDTTKVYNDELIYKTVFKILENEWLTASILEIVHSQSDNQYINNSINRFLSDQNKKDKMRGLFKAIKPYL